MRKVRRVDGERGDGGCDLRGGGSRMARGDRGQEVGVVIPYPGGGVISVIVAVIPAVIRVVIKTVRAVIGAIICAHGSWWRDGRGEGYRGYGDGGNRRDGYFRD